MEYIFPKPTNEPFTNRLVFPSDTWYPGGAHAEDS